MTSLLSGTVTSATNDARLVQSGELDGCGKAGVKVAVGNAVDVSARDVFVSRGAPIPVVVATGVRVAAGADVSLGADWRVGAGV